MTPDVYSASAEDRDGPVTLIVPPLAHPHPGGDPQGAAGGNLKDGVTGLPDGSGRAWGREGGGPGSGRGSIGEGLGMLGRSGNE